MTRSMGPAAGRSVNTPTLGTETRLIGGHAATIYAGQLAVMAFGVVDTVVAGRYSKEALAALSVGSSVYITVYVSLLGVMQALLPIYAEHRGAGRLHAVGAAAHQALYLSVLLIALGAMVMLVPGPVLTWAQVPPDLMADVRSYLAVLALALAPAMWFRMYSSLSQALGAPWLVTWIQVLGLVIKLPLSIVLTFGWMGLPVLGVVGCAWATLIVNVLMLLVAVGVARRSTIYQTVHLWRRLDRPQATQLWALLRLGGPSGLATLIEVSSFTLMALFVARLGAAASASHQIASNVTAILYMFPLALGLAASARTSWHLGAGSPTAAERAVWVSFLLLAGVSITFIAIIFIANESLATFYTHDLAVRQLSAMLLLWVALFHCMDACQALAVALLRSYRVTVLPVVFYAVCLWGLGLGGGYWLCYQGLTVGSWHIAPMQTPSAFWLAGSLANAVVSVALCSLLMLHVRARHRDASSRARAAA